MVKYKYARYYQEYEDQYETLDEAMRRAFNDWDHIEAYPLKIIDSDNVYSYQDILDYWNKQGWLDY